MVYRWKPFDLLINTHLFSLQILVMVMGFQHQFNRIDFFLAVLLFYYLLFHFYQGFQIAFILLIGQLAILQCELVLSYFPQILAKFMIVSGFICGLDQNVWEGFFSMGNEFKFFINFKSDLVLPNNTQQLSTREENSIEGEMSLIFLLDLIPVFVDKI